MNLYHLVDIQAHLLEFCGSFILASSYLLSSPKNLFDKLKSTNKTIHNKDINKNAFAEMFVKQLIHTKNGFLLLAIGYSLLIIGDFTSIYSIGTGLKVKHSVAYLIIAGVTISVFLVVSAVNKKLRNQARFELLNKK